MEQNQDHPEVSIEIDPTDPVVNSPPKPNKNTAPQKALFALCLAILFLGFGFGYKNDCPIDDRIPLLLIITGVLCTIDSLASTWLYFDPQADFQALGITLALGYIALWITGACYVGLAVGKVNHDDVLSKSYCNRNLLRFNYVSYALSIITIVCVCRMAALK